MIENALIISIVTFIFLLGLYGDDFFWRTDR